MQNLKRNDTNKFIYKTEGFPGGSNGKESACNAGDPGSISGSGRSPGEGNVTHSSTLACKIPWTEKPGRLQSMGSQRVGHDSATSLYFCITTALFDSFNITTSGSMGVPLGKASC